MEKSNQLHVILDNHENLTEEQSAYLKYALENSRLTQEFVLSDQSLGLFPWLEEEGYFKDFFNFQGENLELPECRRILLNWMCSVVCIQDADSLIGLIARNQGKFHPEFSATLAHQLWVLDEQSNDPNLNLWLNLLLDRGFDAVRKETWVYLLKSCRFPDNGQVILRILGALTQPSVQPKEPFLKSVEKDYSGPAYHIDLVWDRKAEDWLDEIKKEVLEPGYAEWGAELLELAIHQLVSATMLYRSLVSKPTQWDPINSERSSIAADVEDEELYRYTPHFLIKLARDILDKWLLKEPDRVRNLLFEYLDHSVPIVRRLGVYCLDNHPEISSDAKIEAILDRRFILERGNTVEPHNLLRNHFLSASKEVKSRVIGFISDFEDA